MTEIAMPRLSDTMADGVIAAWRKQVGEPVRSGEVIAEIETDKAIMELEAYDDGVLERILVAEGERVPIGTPIGVVGDGSGTAAAAVDAAPATAVTEPAAVVSEPATTTAAAPKAPANRPRSSPLARKIAAERGIDLTTIIGTGPGGRITRVDVESASATARNVAQPMSPPPAPEQPPTQMLDPAAEPLNSMRRVAAKRLTESKQQAPHIYLTSAVDVTELVAFRASLNETFDAAGGPKVSLNDLLVSAVASALRAHPEINVSYQDGDLLLRHERINIGIAVAVDDGLVVPVLADADQKRVSEVAAATRDKANRARERKLTAAEMTGGTFTISNLGMYGIEHFTAVINPPEAAILAVGAAIEEPRVLDGAIVPRTMLRMTMSADHRVIDGATGAAFLATLTQLLQTPLRIVA